MALLKCAMVGLLTGVVSAVVWAVARVLLIIHATATDGALLAVSGKPSDLFWPGLVGFGVGFVMMLRRQQRRTA